MHRLLKITNLFLFLTCPKFSGCDEKEVVLVEEEEEDEEEEEEGEG